MQANPIFKNKGNDFWAYVRFISEYGGYSRRLGKGQDYSEGKVLAHSKKEIKDYLESNNLKYTETILDLVTDYLKYRAEVLNNFVEPNLMMAPEAEKIYMELKQKLWSDYAIDYSPAFNKQKANKKKPAYFTGIIDYITKITLMQLTGQDKYEFNPLKLVYTTNSEGYLTTTLSRRFDGAYPSLINPRIIWEIKEYYYTTTFGSRIADGVYETQLDGFEINQIEKKYSSPIYHVFFADAHLTWWRDGKSYLCRLVDALNMGLVDELIFGKEVIDRWPVVLKSIVSEKTI
ncbi:hypothetical protein [Lacticaseibacillus paracasei]|uniref:DUF7687 domain-containing protein n=1 Tax=Lacticaseibacillus paracasei TaxID=1597 RepID=UPI0036D3F1FF